jgi:tetratricopeptide (TPR) repeat protein
MNRLKRMMHKILRHFGVLVFFLLLNGWVALTQNSEVDQWFKAGNQFYAQSNFQAAIAEYQKIVRANYVNEWVYYNLGNAYFKTNQLGLAILSYEKARRIAPRERDIAENLELAKSRIVDKVEVPSEGFWMHLVKRTFNLLSINQETATAALFFGIANVLFALLMLRKWERFRTLWLYASLGFFGLFLLFAASNGFRIYQLTVNREAVILVEKADVLSGPASDNPTLYSIHEGLKVQVRAAVGEWVQISLENGWNGWVRKEMLGLI